MEAHEFLVFEDGPSMDFELQWATYRDAADQSALSRIWGGIHPRLMIIPVGPWGKWWAWTPFCSRSSTLSLARYRLL